MYFSEIISYVDYIFIDNINNPIKMEFNISFDKTYHYRYRDMAAPVFRKVQNGSDYLFESGYLINDNFVICPLKIQNVSINCFEIISHKLNSKLTAYVNNENNKQKIINLEVILIPETSSLPRIIDCLNLYINSGKDLEMLDISIFQSDILLKHYHETNLLQLINNLNFDFYDIYMFSVGKDDREWTEVYISNLPESNYLSELFKTILTNLNFKITFDAERISIYECQPYENEKDKEIIKDHLKYNLKEYFKPELELLDRMSLS